MKEKRIGFVVSHLVSGEIRLDGGLEIKRTGRPDVSVQVGSTLYHVYLSSFIDKPLTKETRRRAIELVPEVLRQRMPKEN